MFARRIRPEAPSDANRIPELEAAIAARLERGETLESVEREVIAPSGLPEELQSALWLYAWSHPKRRVSRPAAALRLDSARKRVVHPRRDLLLLSRTRTAA